LGRELSCSVEAVFELKTDSPVWDILVNDAGVEVDSSEDLIIKRIVSSGANKQFINNSPVTLNLLKKIGLYLVDLHGPHDHQGLLSNDQQRSMLDAFCGNDEAYCQYRADYQQWRNLRQQLDDVINSEKSGDHELELLKYQFEEIDSANVSLVEEESLELDFKKASNSSQLTIHASCITGLLSGGIIEQLSEIQRSMRELEKLDPSTAEVFTNVDSAIMELQDLESSMVDYADSTEVDDTEVRRLEERINIYETLKRKYGPTLLNVTEHLEVVRVKLDTIENRDSVIGDLEKATEKALNKAQKSADKLTESRKKNAPKLVKQIVQHLKDLGFKQAGFNVEFTHSNSLCIDGREKVDFQFGPNPGEPLKPLKQIASSGEISRVMLSLKSALAKQEVTTLMVFDEIDANVGGEIARAVGEKMAKLGVNHQVISISHFPQVAAVANQHFLVEKLVVEDRAVSKMRQVEGSQRVGEIVRMLGAGDNKEAREMAQSLLKFKL